MADSSGKSEEDKVKEELYKTLDKVYTDRLIRSRDVVEEYKIESEFTESFIDVAIPELNIAIECKNSEAHNAKKGIGQALRYNVSGWSSYLCIPYDSISSETVNICLDGGVGLVGVTNVNNSNDSEVIVIVQNDKRLFPKAGKLIRQRDDSKISEFIRRYPDQPYRKFFRTRWRQVIKIDRKENDNEN